MKNKNGLSGLVNIGNTCYINSCMQILSHTYELNNILDKINNLNDNEDKTLITEWNDLRKMLWNENCCISPNRFIRTIHNLSREKGYIFNGYVQNDIQEYLLFVIDTFHNSIKRKVNMNITGEVKNDNDKYALECYKMMSEYYSNDYSDLINVFYGIQISLLKDISNNEVLNIKPEPFFILNLPLPNIEGHVFSLYDCLDEYCKMETLKDDNAWYNEETNKKVDVNKMLIFWKLPTVLIIDLKRWSYNEILKKNKNNIQIPFIDLNMNKYTYMKDNNVYDLYGICNHIGDMNGGHYNSYIKTFENKWYLFDDNNIINIDETKMNTNNAYCLFYRKKIK
jgi:ubiquitin carboxyl-terminal hydrolase 8